MRKMVKNKKEGVVDLNQAKLQDFENARPKVPSSQKVPNPNNKNRNKNPGDADKMPTINKGNKKIKPIGNVKNFKDNASKIFNRDENGKILITRRTAIYGALGAGALLIGGAGVKFVSDSVNKAVNSVDTLQVPKTSVVSSDNFSEVPDNFLTVENEIQLPYGTLA